MDFDKQKHETLLDAEEYNMAHKINHIDKFVANKFSAIWKRHQLANICLCLLGLVFISGIIAAAQTALSFVAGPLCTLCAIAELVIFISLYTTRKNAQQAVKESAADYVVKNGAYIIHQNISSRGNRVIVGEKYSLYVFFYDENNKKQKAYSPFANERYFKKMSKGAPLKIVHIKGLWDKTFYVALLPQFFSDANS